MRLGSIGTHPESARRSSQITFTRVRPNCWITRTGWSLRKEVASCRRIGSHRMKACPDISFTILEQGDHAVLGQTFTIPGMIPVADEPLVRPII